MLKPHQELLATLKNAHAQAVAIEREGGAVMGIIHHLRSANELTALRVQNYEQGEAEAKAAAEAEAATKAAADAEAKAKSTGGALSTATK